MNTAKSSKDIIIEEQKTTIRLLTEELAYLKEKLAYLQILHFGRKSEKISKPQIQHEPVQLTLDFGDNPEDETRHKQGETSSETDASENKAVSVNAHKRSKPGRKPLPKDLPRKIVTHELPPEELQCKCGHIKQCIGYESSEKLVVIPERFFIEEHRYFKYACKSCCGTSTEGVSPTVVIAPAEESVLPKCFATPSLLAYILVSKFCDALPFYRLEGIMGRNGVDLNRGTMCRWATQAAHKLTPMAELFLEAILGGDVIFMDETTVQVNKEPGRAASAKSYMWVMVSGGGSPPTILFNYNQSRSSKVAKDLLKNYARYVMTDGYDGYNFADEAGSEAIRLACWAHARRKFFEALELIDKKDRQDSIPQKAIEHIQGLYKVEKEIRETIDFAEIDRYEKIKIIRFEKALPILEKLKKDLEEWRPMVPSRTKTGKAISYALNLWKQLIRYLEDGKCPIDNNAAENAIRPFVVGRKAWLFCDTVEGATATAVYYSIINTAKANKLDPYWYMCYLLDKLPKLKCKKDFIPFIPQNVKKEDIQKFKEESIKNTSI